MSYSKIYLPSVGGGGGGGDGKRRMTFQTINVDHSWELELRVNLTTAEAV